MINWLKYFGLGVVVGILGVVLFLFLTKKKGVNYEDKTADDIIDNHLDNGSDIHGEIGDGQDRFTSGVISIINDVTSRRSKIRQEIRKNT